MAAGSARIRTGGAAVYVGGDQYGPTFEGMPPLPSNAQTPWITAFGLIGPPILSFAPLRGPIDLWAVAENAAADESAVYVQSIGATSIDGFYINGWVLSRYIDGQSLWTIFRRGLDSLHIEIQDGVLFTSFGGGLHPIVVDPTSGTVLWEYDVSGTGAYYNSGAAKGQNASLYVVTY